MARIPVILDCDPGHDDAFAILLACASPELEVLAITTVAGNQTLPRTTLNALKLATVAGIRGVPIAAGMDRPLVRPLVTAGHVHGETGLDGPALPEPAIEPDPRHAVDLIIELLRAAREPVTLIPTGPLTNIALVLQKAPGLRERIARIVLMGGAIAEGNVTPAAEFNIYVDPEAAHLVFTAGLPVTMIGLDVTHQAIATPADAARLRERGGPVGVVAADILEFYFQFHRRQYGMEGGPLHDPVAVAQVVQPGIVRTRPMHVAVELRGEHTTGRTVCDVWGVTGHPANAEVGVGLDRDAFFALLHERLARYA